MRDFFARALDNVISHGDTDVFPYPFENLVFYDQREDVLSLLESIHGDADFEERLAHFPPSNESLLAPIGYTGFRWATQLDPLWNVYLLRLVLSIADSIESARTDKAKDIVFSYRYHYDPSNHDVFQRDIGWTQFVRHSLQLSNDYSYVVVCDISDFYQRLGHHRLENALGQLHLREDRPWRIMKILAHFSGARSYGIPVGGPAARLLSELVLNHVDRLLILHKVPFCRFSDDYHIFANSVEQAYDHLVFLSEMAKWAQWPWLSDLKSSFRGLGPSERRAYLIGSFVLDDEGRHWRRHIRRELSEFEILVRDWATAKKECGRWRVPI